MEDPLGRQILLVVLLIIVNALFAAAEIAVLSLNAAKVRHEAEEGDKRAKKMLKLVDKPANFLSTIQVVINLAGLLASAYTADSMAGPLVNWLLSLGWQINPSTLNSLVVLVITIVLAFFMILFGELVPKRIAMVKSEQVAKLMSSIVIFAGIIFRPMVWLLTVSTNGILRLLKIDPNQSNENVSEEEIRLMVDIGEEKGAIEAAEREMIDNIFEFNNTTAEEVMIHRTDMIVVWLEDSSEEIIQRIRESGRSRFPVCGDDVDDVRGLLMTKTFLLNLQAEQSLPWQELVTPIFFAPEQVQADVLFRDMQRKKMHMAIVVDEYGGTSGLVTMENLLEEIVGNIYDEHDEPDEQEIIQVEENLWCISGSCEIEMLCEVLGITPPAGADDEEFDTLGGLIFSCMSEIPADGSQPELEIWGLSIKVESIVERRVEWALVRKLLANGEQAADA